MTRPLYIWLGFLASLAVVAGALGWISATVIRLDRAEAEARLTAAREENVRLALWRMDSMAAPLIAQESARPFFLYHSFFPVDRPYGRMLEPVGPRDQTQDSPLLRAANPKISLYFQFGPDGELTSPQAPRGEWRRRAIEAGLSESNLSVAELRLRKFGDALGREALLAAMSGGAAPGQAVRPSERPDGLASGLDTSQQIRNVIEYTKRREVAERTGAALGGDLQDEPGMRPLWINGMMILTRRVAVNGEDYVQGCWLNWAEVRSSLLGEIRDLLPGAGLEPVAPGEMPARANMLTGLPARLTLGEGGAAGGGADAMPPPRNTALMAALGAAWAGVGLAAAAFVLLFFGVLRLNERRDSFVSAVTHELRTPITSLRMYTEMMTSGMIRSEDKVREYLRTMRAEIDRLGHLVENVLAYSRLERGRARGRIEALTLAELVDRVKHRLTLRAEQAGFRVAVELNERRAGAKVRVDITAIEQILFNLVDNACKYGRTGAGGGRDTRAESGGDGGGEGGASGAMGNGLDASDHYVIHFQAGVNGRWAALRIRDHGPGIRPEDAERLFKPFTKSARDAAQSAPGVGLGLALSRRLARLMGGDLDIDPAVRDGACFVLTLPTVG